MCENTRQTYVRQSNMFAVRFLITHDKETEKLVGNALGWW
jgi:hypothetical protein